MAEHPVASTRIRVTCTYVAPSSGTQVRSGSSTPAPCVAPEPAAVEILHRGEPATVSNGKAQRVYEKRVRVLALAKELGNVSEACRIVGVSRRSYYTWKRIAERQGIEALKPRSNEPGPADGA